MAEGLWIQGLVKDRKYPNVAGDRISGRHIVMNIFQEYKTCRKW